MADFAAAPLPGSPGAPLWDPLAVPAATVIVLRDGTDGPEVLMLKRDRDLSFAGGMWVFPGGRIDDGDRTGLDPADPADALEAAARRAAAREAAEESGVEIDSATLRRWSHWTPPPLQDKRFSTAFFVAPAVDASVEVTIDDGEIRAHRWARPAEVIERRDAGEVALAPPTFITLLQLLAHRTVADVLDAAPTGPVEHFSTRVALPRTTVPDSAARTGWTAVYHGDTVFDALGDAGGMAEVDLDAPGPRHRLVMAERWSYERVGC